jgi:hypothetical protein
VACNNLNLNYACSCYVWSCVMCYVLCYTLYYSCPFYANMLFVLPGMSNVVFLAHMHCLEKTDGLIFQTGISGFGRQYI